MRPSGVSHSTVVPVADGARRRHRSRRPPASPRVNGSSSADSADSTSAKTTAPSTGRPSSVSIDDARSASSGGYDDGLILIPMPRITCCRPSADDEASARTPASFRRRDGPPVSAVTTSLGHLISSGRPLAARMPPATATPAARVRNGAARTDRMTVEK